MDLQNLIDGLAAQPFALEYWWIYFMMLTTLLPTFIHLIVAGAAAVMIFPNTWRQFILQNWNERGDAQFGALWYVTIMPALGALGIIVPCLVFYMLCVLFNAHSGMIGSGLLEWARTLSTAFDLLNG